MGGQKQSVKTVSYHLWSRCLRASDVERRDLRDALRLAAPHVGDVDVKLHVVAVRVVEVQRLRDLVIDWIGHNPGIFQMCFGLDQLVQRVTDTKAT